MANDSVLNKIMAISPHIEMIVRRLYYSYFFQKFFSRKKTFRSKAKGGEDEAPLNLDEIISTLVSYGINKGDLAIVHSTSSPFKKSKISESQVISKLRDMLGRDGTLAMPVIRIYKSTNSQPKENAEIPELNELVYDVVKTKVWTGSIPTTLMRMPGSVTSRFPLNTLTAIGPLAQQMMKDNLNDPFPTANGSNSSWEFCARHNAWIIALGIDLAHSLTMIHTVEDVMRDKWPIADWYRERRFIIRDGDFETKKLVYERRPKWGMLHFAERTLARDLINSGILRSTKKCGILIEVLRSHDLIEYLKSKNKEGYPYFWVRRYLRAKSL